MGKQTSAVVTELRRNIGSGSYENYPIGTDIRFISPSRASGSNNFEEDLLIGVNKIIEISKNAEEHSTIKTTEFRSADQLSNFYKLVTKTYSSATDGGNVAIDYSGDTLQFTLLDSSYDTSSFSGKSNPRVEGRGLYINDLNFKVEGNGLYQEQVSDILYQDTENEHLVFLPVYITEEDILYYVDTNGQEITISTKEIKEQSDKDGVQHITEVVLKNNNG